MKKVVIGVGVLLFGFSLHAMNQDVMGQEREEAPLGGSWVVFPESEKKAGEAQKPKHNMPLNYLESDPSAGEELAPKPHLKEDDTNPKAEDTKTEEPDQTIIENLLKSEGFAQREVGKKYTKNFLSAAAELCAFGSWCENKSVRRAAVVGTGIAFTVVVGAAYVFYKKIN